MRIALPLLIACALVAAPASADDYDYDYEAEHGSETRRMADELRDPVRQAQLAATATVLTEALLAIDAAPLARAMATIEGVDPDYVDPDLRVGDLVAPDTVDASREFATRLPQMMGALAAFSVALEDMLPQVRALGEGTAEDLRD